ncbi:MAG: TerC family protein [Deltaproteobacteria bacterium]|nr:TerC family protein [Deltaproteobacteria bacterium]
MIGQDLATIGTLAILEGLLSADNALVLAVMVKHLPVNERKKALRYGIWGAFIFRIIAILVATWLINVWIFKAIGAVYLIFISLKHLLSREHHQTEGKKVAKMGFWKTVAVVELTDIVFSVDSILAAVALSSKIWIIYLGGVLGIIAMRLVAGGFLKLIDRFPNLEMGAYMLVGWIGLKLGIETLESQIAGFPHIMHPALFWGVMATIFVGSMLWKKKPRQI